MKSDPDVLFRDDIPREVIDAARLPENPTDLPEYLRLMSRWIGAALPNAHFECLALRLASARPERSEDARGSNRSRGMTCGRLCSQSTSRPGAGRRREGGDNG
jgi:hypothetical protein